MTIDYDRWLEKPYQDAYAAAEVEEYYAEKLIDEYATGDFDPCAHCTHDNAGKMTQPCDRCIQNRADADAEYAADLRAEALLEQDDR